MGVRECHSVISTTKLSFGGDLPITERERLTPGSSPGYATLRSWNLSDDICDSARAMDPEMSQPDRPIIRIVQAADVIAQKLGMHPHPNPDLNLMDQDAIESLEIGDVELGALIVDLEDEIDEVRSAFGAG